MTRRCDECDEPIEEQDPVVCKPDFKLACEEGEKACGLLKEALRLLCDVSSFPGRRPEWYEARESLLLRAKDVMR